MLKAPYKWVIRKAKNDGTKYKIKKSIKKSPTGKFVFYDKNFFEKFLQL